MKNLYFIVLLFSSYLSFSQTNYQRIWSTYFGCKGTVLTNSVIDHQGNIYLVGYIITYNNLNDPIYTTFATSGAHLEMPGSNAGLIAKFTSTGNLLWSTFFDTTFSNPVLNSGTDITAVAVDSANNLYISGYCPIQNNIPVGSYTNPGVITEPVSFDIVAGGYTNYLAKFSSSGVQQWGKFISGSVLNIVFDINDVMYVGGLTNYQTQVGTPNTFQPNYINYNSTTSYYFISRFTTDGVKIWGTYYGYEKNFSDYNAVIPIIISLATDSSGNLYVAGNIHLYTFNYYATSGCFQNDANYPQTDANGSSFISKFNSSGQRIWSTYFGLSQNLSTTVITDIAVSGSNLYITGVTNASTSIATQGAFQPTKAGPAYTGTDNRDAYDGYITKFDLNGNRIWGTYCGGALEDRVNKIQVKNNGIFIAGITKSPDGISTLDGFQNSLTTPVDATTAIYFFDSFVSKFDLNGTKIWGTYFGGNKGESGKNNTYPDTFIVLSDTGTLYLAGNSSSENNIATSDGFQPAWNNLPNPNLYTYSTNFYLAKFDPVPLNTENFAFDNLKFAPNPTSNVVTISNNSTIESFEILSVLGQKLVSKNCNSLQTQVDFSAFSNGIYFIKISSQGFEKKIKIFKE